MKKIANTTELQTELRKVLAYAQTDHPSRNRIARELEGLSTRIAAQGGSLLQAKVAWALELGEIMSARFSGAGGWRDHHIKPTTHRTNSGCAVELQSELGWSCGIDISVEGAGQVEVHFNVSDAKSTSTGLNGLPDLGDIDLSDLLGRTTHASFPIKDREPMAKAMMDVSLWISKQLPRH